MRRRVADVGSPRSASHFSSEYGARTIRNGVGGMVRFRIGELDMVVDFPKAKVREYAGEECIYWYTIPADLVSTNIRDHEIDWSNSIFLSIRPGRMSAGSSVDGRLVANMTLMLPLLSNPSSCVMSSNIVR